MHACHTLHKRADDPRSWDQWADDQASSSTTRISSRARPAAAEVALQLAHAHGLGLSLLNIVYALCLRQVRPSAATLGSVASLCLLWSTAIMPLGFLLGGAVTRDGDPGPGVFLVPLGAFLLCIGVLLAARELSRSLSESSEG